MFDQAYKERGGNAKEVIFEWKNKANPSQVRKISVYDFFKEQYRITIQHWQLPLIETQRDGFFPMELCTLVANQKYQYKLSPDQVSFFFLFRSLTTNFFRLLP